MATLNVQTETTEQSPTLESGVDISQRNQEVEEATLDSRREQETLTVEHGVRTESDALQQSVTSRSQQPTLEQGLGTGTRSQTSEQGLQTQEQTPKTLSDREMSKIVDSITLKIVANEWIEKCEDLRSWIQATEWSNKSRRELREKIQRWIKDMKKMVEDINRFERRWQVYSNTDRYKDRLWEIIFDYYSSWEPARQIIVMWWRVPMIRWTVDSRRDARKDNNYAEDNAEYQIDFSELKKNTAIYNMIWVSASEWWDYCDFVWQWWIAIGHPVYVQHKAGFDNINMYNPDLYRRIVKEILNYMRHIAEIIILYVLHSRTIEDFEIDLQIWWNKYFQKGWIEILGRDKLGLIYEVCLLYDEQFLCDLKHYKV